MDFDALGKEMRTVAPGVEVTAMTYNDIKFLRACGVCCWHLAGSLTFQHLIHDCGTPEEQKRLRDMRVGYPW